MRSARHLGFGLLAASLALAWPMRPAAAQTIAPAPAQAQSLIDQLTGPESTAATDVAALQKQAAARIQSRADAAPLRRPQIAPQLLKLPHIDFDVVFDPDTAIIRPQSYQVIGRIADALSDPKLRPYVYLVVGHTESTGNRAANLALSQRRADALRSVLAGSFKVSPRRLQALGLGEEQLQDANRPTAPANARAQIFALGTVPATDPPAAGSPPPAKKSAAKAKKRQ
jgi:OmpA-OmpF porin, OOP family